MPKTMAPRPIAMNDITIERMGIGALADSIKTVALF